MLPRCSRTVSTLLATALLAASLGCSNRGGDNNAPPGIPFGGSGSGGGAGGGGGGGGGAAGAFEITATNPDSGPVTAAIALATGATAGFPTLAPLNNVDPANAVISVTFAETPTTGAADPTAIDRTVNGTPLNFQVIETTNSQLLSVPVGAGNVLILQGAVNFDPNTNTATFVPDVANPLQLNTQYTVIIRGIVTDDANGVALSQFDYVFYFQTDAVNNFVPQAPNVVDFTVVQTNPATATNNGNPFAAAYRHDPTDRTLNITFSKNVAIGTLNDVNVVVEADGVAPVISGVLTVQNALVTFTADAAFPANTLVTVTLNAGLQATDGSPLHPYVFRVITRSNVATGDFLINEVLAHNANAVGVSFPFSDANNNGIDEPFLDQFVEYVNVSGANLDVTQLACGSSENIVLFIGSVATPLLDGFTGNDITGSPTLANKVITANRALLFLLQDSNNAITAANPILFDFGVGTSVRLLDFVFGSPTQAPDTSNPADGIPDPTPFLGNEFTDPVIRGGTVFLFDPIGDPLNTNPIDQFAYGPVGLQPDVQLPLPGVADSIQREQDASNANAAVAVDYSPHSGQAVTNMSPGKTFGGGNFP